MSRMIMYTGERREQIPDVLRQHGISVESVPGNNGEQRYRCTRGAVAARITISKTTLPLDLANTPRAAELAASMAFSVLAEAESTGWKFWKWDAAGSLVDDIRDLIMKKVVQTNA